MAGWFVRMDGQLVSLIVWVGCISAVGLEFCARGQAGSALAAQREGLPETPPGEVLPQILFQRS